MIELREIGLDSGRDGLEILQKLANDSEIFDGSPVPKEIDSHLYLGFLVMAEEEREYCHRYWVTYRGDIIGYSDIRLNPEYAEVGLALDKDFRDQGLGLVTLRTLIDKAKNEFDKKTVVVSVDPKNEKMIRLCEKIGGELGNTDNKRHYFI